MWLRDWMFFIFLPNVTYKFDFYWYNLIHNKMSFWVWMVTSETNKRAGQNKNWILNKKQSVLVMNLPGSDTRLSHVILPSPHQAFGPVPLGEATSVEQHVQCNSQYLATSRVNSNIMFDMFPVYRLTYWAGVSMYSIVLHHCSPSRTRVPDIRASICNHGA